ncbi:hypothetical protein AF72_11140 [Xylella taiwanensis]|uniref:Uncharacterized protein n=1 Tax=Xylella taiwanensis TaxID=1444770 RepID=Z9JHC1_9GAMM|nr:hypothetical protein AB672_00235 [Xylella taiwanensis]EWS77408.1 hypothetical protein AF72_11140 [Xylella taiwanensis]
MVITKSVVTVMLWDAAVLDTTQCLADEMVLPCLKHVERGALHGVRVVDDFKRLKFCKCVQNRTLLPAIILDDAINLCFFEIWLSSYKKLRERMIDRGKKCSPQYER